MDFSRLKFRYEIYDEDLDFLENVSNLYDIDLKTLEKYAHHFSVDYIREKVAVCEHYDKKIGPAFLVSAIERNFKLSKGNVKKLHKIKAIEEFKPPETPILDIKEVLNKMACIKKVLRNE